MTPPPRCLPAALLALLVVAPGTASAAALPQWAKAIARAAAPATPPDAHAVVLFDQTAIRYDRESRLRIVRRKVMRILDSEGLNAASLVVLVDAGGAIESFEAWTFSGDEVRATAHAEQRVESMLSTEGPTDVRRAALGAPSARAGDVLVFEATWSEPSLLPVRLWLPQEANLPVVRAELAIDLPKGWSAEVSACGVVAVDEAPGPELVRLALDNLAMLPDEPSRPADSRLLPRIHVRLADAQGRAPFANWATLARWGEELVGAGSSASACPPQLRPTGAPGDPVEVVTRLARQVQSDVRYVAIELGMRRWQPDSAALTWRQRYGDCKDKSALLASALEANGIRARLVLACTRNRWDVDPDAPSPFEFNHCIVALRWPGPEPPAAATVTTKDGHAWTLFDPTDESVPFGSLSSLLGGTWAVIAAEDGGLVRLPQGTPSTIRRVVTGRLGETGELSGRLVVLADGPLSEAYRVRFGGPDEDRLRARARDFLGSHWAKAALDSCSVLVDSREGQRFGLVLDFRLKGAARAEGQRWLYTPRFETRATAAPPADTSRTLPMVLGEPGRYDEDWQVELPPGFGAESRAPIEWRGPAGQYSTRFEAGPSRLTVKRRLDLRLEQLPASEIAQARALLRAIYAGDRASVVLTRR